MKAMLRAASLVVALIVVIGAGRLFAEDKEHKPAKAAKPRTRIAILNLTYVIKHYDKYKQFQEEINETVAPYKNRDQKLRARMNKLEAEANKNVKEEESSIVPAKAEDLEENKQKSQQKRKEEIEQKAKKVKRDLEDNNQEAKQVLSKKSDAEMQILYKDVYEAARRYAAKHDLDLVLHYNDAVNMQDYMSPQNIARKLNTGALSPLYVAPGMDISKPIADLLNKEMRKK